MYYEINDSGNKIRPLPGYFDGFKEDLLGVEDSMLFDTQKDYLSIPSDCIIEISENEHEVWEYQQQALQQLSSRCKYERSQILSDTTIMNILSGATAGYPEHLTPANVALMFEQYKTIYHTAAAQIQAAESKDDIDIIMDKLVFPTEEEIISYVS